MTGWLGDDRGRDRRGGCSRGTSRASHPGEVQDARDAANLGQGKPFVLERIDHNGVVLPLGKQRNYTPLEWDRLEGIVPFLLRHPGWVPAGGTFVVGGERGTLDEYLKGCISRQTSRWVAVVLQEAGVVRVHEFRGSSYRFRQSLAAREGGHDAVPASLPGT